MEKAPDAFRTISEAAEELDVPQHVLRFWETRFSQVRPMKRAGGRRYYRPQDVDLLRGIRRLLYDEGYTIKGVQKILREHGIAHVIAIGRGEVAMAPAAGLPVAPVQAAGKQAGAAATTPVRQGRADGEKAAAAKGATREAAAASAITPVSSSSSALDDTRKAALQEALQALEQAHGMLQNVAEAAEGLEKRLAGLLEQAADDAIAPDREDGQHSVEGKQAASAGGG